MKILICSDGSSQAESAVRFGGSIAAACQAEVTLLGIVEEAMHEEALFHALRGNVQVLREKNLPVELITRSGDPVTEILKQSQQVPYDLVIIGAVRKGTKGAFWMSAKAYNLIKDFHLPVLVVIGHPEELRRMLICSSGTSYVNKAVRFAGHLAQCTGATATLVHVVAQPPAIYADLIARLEDVQGLLASRSILGRNLRRQKQILESMKVPIEVKLRHGPVVWELLAELRQGHYDLLVLGFAAGPGPLRSYLMGDITRELVNRADCPVLVVRGEQERKAAEGIASLGARLREIFAPATAGSVTRREAAKSSPSGIG